jgi:hypothetical protein
VKFQTPRTKFQTNPNNPKSKFQTKSPLALVPNSIVPEGRRIGKARKTLAVIVLVIVY